MSQASDDAVACSYCRHAMIRVTLGWHCPACHASVGQEPALHA